jgi:hypothetical protein
MDDAANQVLSVDGGGVDGGGRNVDGVWVGVGVGGADAVGVGVFEACNVEGGSFIPLVGLVHGHSLFSMVIADGLELGD